MSERNVLAACLKSRGAWEAVADHINADEFGEQSNIVLRHIAAYYDRDTEAQSVDPELLARDVSRSISNPKHQEAFEYLIRLMDESDVSPANVVHDFIAVKRDLVGDKVAAALAAGRTPTEVLPLIAEYESWCDAETLTDGKESEVFHGENVGDLVRTRYESTELIQLYPKALNDRLEGGLLRGHHVIVFARPEVGKTLFLVNAVFGFLKQGLTVLYVGNEDPISDIVLRVVSRLTGKTKYEILEDPDSADEIARMRGYDNLILAELAPGTPRQIEGLVAEYRPDVLLLDQLRNINVGEEHFVQKLEKAATAARNIGKKHNALVVSVTQAGDSADNKQILGMGDIDSSKTGIPGQADLMIGIGCNADDEVAGRRVLSMPKNKISGRHEYFPVKFDPQISKIRSIE